MNEKTLEDGGFNRREFLKGGSVATLMAMLGGVEIISRAAEAPKEIEYQGPPLKVAIIGMGGWGRELLNTMLPMKTAEVVAVCDNYPAFLKRAGNAAPKAKQVTDYKAILADKDIGAVFIATATHQHKEIAIEALKAGKHVYCEAPLANTIEDAKEIAMAAKAASKTQIFQPGLQLRCEPHRHFLLPFIRSGAIGNPVMVRAQWHKKMSWRAVSPNPEREKALNWRLDKNLSIGLMGEIGLHHIDQVGWFLNSWPKAVSGYGGLHRWTEDGREVPDTAQVMFEFPGDVAFNFDATIASSFDASYELFHGSDSTVMIRDNKAWMFKEVDAPLLGWEVYAKKQEFYHETGIALMAGASKSAPPATTVVQDPETDTLKAALNTFLRNAIDLVSALKLAKETYGDDAESIAEQLSQTPRRTAATYVEGYRATVLGIKANEAVLARKRIELNRDMYNLAPT